MNVLDAKAANSSCSTGSVTNVRGRRSDECGLWEKVIEISRGGDPRGKEKFLHQGKVGLLTGIFPSVLFYGGMSFSCYSGSVEQSWLDGMTRVICIAQIASFLLCACFENRSWTHHGCYVGALLSGLISTLMGHWVCSNAF